MTRFLKCVLLLCYETSSRSCALSVCNSFSKGAKNWEVNRWRSKFSLSETLKTFTGSHKLKLKSGFKSEKNNSAGIYNFLKKSTLGLRR